MKRIYFLIAFQFWAANILFAQTEFCKHPNGLYQYYLRLNKDVVCNNMNKLDFLFFLSQKEDISEADSQLIADKVPFIEKSFPSAKTAELQKTISVFSTDYTLEKLFGSFTNSIALAEFFCWDPIVLNNGEISKIKSGISIYPNPVMDYSIIQFNPQSGFKTLRIMSHDGRLIFSQNIGNRKIIPVNQFDLTKGVYFVQVLDNDQKIMEIRRIVKVN